MMNSHQIEEIDFLISEFNKRKDALFTFTKKLKDRKLTDSERVELDYLRHWFNVSKQELKQASEKYFKK